MTIDNDNQEQNLDPSADNTPSAETPAGQEVQEVLAETPEAQAPAQASAGPAAPAVRRDPFAQAAAQGRGPRGGGGGGDRGRKGGGGGGRDGGPGRGRDGGRAPGAPGGRAPEEEADRNEWKEKVIQIRRVTKVVKGGKKLSFRAVVVVGNGSGQVGIGIGKSNEVIGAIQKGVSAAKKTLITVPIHKTTIPHAIKAKAGGSSVVLLPASEGTGVIAGGAARALLELAGVENILSKSLGSNSPLNVARATLRGLSELRTFESIAKARGKTVKEILL